jgi:ABC-2 type transport system permease protein
MNDGAISQPATSGMEATTHAAAQGGVPLLRSVPRPPPPSAFSNALVFAWRAVLKFRHVPEQLFDLVMTPIMFTLLFTFVFGGALAGSPDDYLQVFIPGILVQTVVFNAVYSGMGLSTDLGKGLFDRFRSLPIWSLAPFAGLMVGDILRHLIAGGIILTIGLILGYRPEAGVVGVVAAFLLLLTIGFGVGWIFLVLGLLVKTPMTVMTIGFAFLFPINFASNIMVDPATMPDWLRSFVDVNPVSFMTTAMRGLMAGTATVSEVALALAAPVLLTLLLAPVTLVLYRRR